MSETVAASAPAFTGPTSSGGRLGLGIAVLMIALGAIAGGVWINGTWPGPGLLVVVLAIIGLFAAVRIVLGPGMDLGLVISLSWLVLIVGAAFVADLLPLAEGQDPSKTLLDPVRAAPILLSPHPLGTDNDALDVLAGVIYGGRVSMLLGVGAAALGFVLGGGLGLVAGFLRGKVDFVLSLLADAALSLPPLILLLALASIVTPNVPNMLLVLGALTTPTFFRLARANTLVLSQREYVLAARSLGATTRRILLREVLPFVVRAVASYGFIVIGIIIVAEASVSFLGVGIPRPQPSWGNMIAAGSRDFEKYPLLVLIPAAALFGTVISLNTLGEWAQRRWDPRQAKL